ncbi:MAG: hypothetical protein ACRDSL_09930 [Pseudonocardiaceae bacterium]
MFSDPPGELPPRPDRETGEPRPPRAPAMWEGGKGDPEVDPRRRPTPPEGQGPPLEWHRDSGRATYRVVVIAFGFMFVVMTLIAWGFSWTTDWVFWLIVLLLPLIMFLSSRSRWMAAGADWFASNTGWVKIYDLTEIELAGNAISPRLYLTDTEGHAAHAELRQMQANSRLWDLVYNGIIHSFYTRVVKVNTAARVQVVERDFPRHRRD